MVKAILKFLCWTVPILLCDGLRLTIFVLLLTPGFLRFAWYYGFVADRTTVRYANDSCRQTLDVYKVKQSEARTLSDAEVQENHIVSETRDCSVGKPVVVFCTGGAWLIGYKMWGALLARAMTSLGIVVVVPDYRNYPWARVPDMVRDVQQVVVWTENNISDYGGDPTKVVLVGQSAGGHLAATALLHSVLRRTQSSESCSTQTWGNAGDDLNASFDRVKLSGFIAISSPLDLEAMPETFHRHGMDDTIVNRIFGDGQRDDYSPLKLAERIASEGGSYYIENMFPPSSIFHGTADKTVPYQSSEVFVETFSQVYPDIQYSPYQGRTHTDTILEGPMGGDNFFHRDLFEMVRQWTRSDELEWQDDHPMIGRICPLCLIPCAKVVNPF